MVAAAGPILAACLLLAAAGVAKLWRPSATARALRSGGLPSREPAVRALGAFEVGAAVWCALSGSRPACAVVAVLYLGFALFTARLLVGGKGASCGCFGEVDAPASPIHVAVNLGLAVFALAGAMRPPGSLASVLADQPMSGVPFLALAVLGAWSSYLTLTLLPALADAARRVEGVPR